MPKRDKVFLLAILCVFATELVASHCLQPVEVGASDLSPLPEFFTSTRRGVVRIFSNGSKQIFEDIHSGYSLEILDDKLYANRNYNYISVYTKDGVYLKNVSIPSPVTYLTFVVLPDERIAFLDNHLDKVHFLNSSGNLIASVNILNVPDDELQNVDGVVSNNQLIVSEDGNNNILQIDLGTYQVSVFKNLSQIPPWLGAITYSNSYYYVCGSSSIYRFSRDSNVTKVAEVPDHNISGIVVVGRYAYVATNFGGKIHKVDLETGTSEVFVSDLDYPRDLEVTKFAVAKLNATLSMHSSVANVEVGYTTRLSGSLSPAQNGTVKIFRSSNGSSFQLIGSASISGGDYFYQSQLSDAGTYQFYVSWDGNEEYNSARSGTVSVTVIKAPQPVSPTDPTWYVAIGVLVVTVIGVMVYFFHKK